MEDCHGDMSQIADNIVLELQDLPALPTQGGITVDRCDAASDVNPRNRFDKLWQFLRDQKTVLVQLEQLQITRRPNSARAGEPIPL